MNEENLEPVIQKRLTPSLSFSNIREKNNYNDLKLNFNYQINKEETKYNPININNNKIIDNLIPFDINTSKIKKEQYEEYIYEEGDKYEKLINKNKNLKRLFEKVNGQLLTCLKKQQEMEKKYENEKKQIIEKLTKIQSNYEMYANSHQQLNNFEDKIGEISSTYNQLLELYFKTNEKLKEYINYFNKLYKNINNFIEKNYEQDNVNIVSFEFLLHLRNEIKDHFKINELNLNKKNILQRNNYNEIVNNKTARYYTNKYYNYDFSDMKNKNNNTNIFHANTNFYLINKKKKELIKSNKDIKIKSNKMNNISSHTNKKDK